MRAIKSWGVLVAFSLLISATALGAPYATLTNFFPGHFTVTPSASDPTQVIKMFFRIGQVDGDPDTPGISITNLPYATNIVLWTNKAGVLQPTAGSSVLVTNLSTEARLLVNGSFVLYGLLSTNLVTGTNGLNPYNVGTIQATGPTATPSDTFISLTSGNGAGQILIIENYTDGQGFCITNMTPQWDNPSQLIRLSNGDWCPTQRGESIWLRVDTHGDWVEVLRQVAQYNYFNNVYATNIYTANIYVGGSTNSGGAMNPTIGRVPYKATTNAFGDSPWQALANTNALGFNSSTTFLRSETGVLSAGTSAGEDFLSGTLVAFGPNAGANATTGNNNTAFGDGALQATTTGNFNTAGGYQSLNTLNSGSGNTAYGNYSGTDLVTGSDNSFFGNNAGKDQTSGSRNTGFGSGTIAGNDFVSDRTAVGYFAAHAGGGGVAVGSNAGLAATGNNTLVGVDAGRTLTTSQFNTLIGGQAGWTIASDRNVWVGDELQTGTSNGLDAQRSVIVGYRRIPQGDPLTNITDSVFLGSITGLLTNSATKITNAITIGNNVLPTNSNEIVIGNTANTRTVIAGKYVIPAEIWDDSQVPAMSITLGATAPSLEDFNGGPGKTYCFNNNQDDEGYSTLQLPHRYKQGSTISPHVHWAETATTGAGTNIVWELSYSWGNLNTAAPGYSTVTITNSVTGTNWFHSISGFPDISGTGKHISSMFVFRIRRLASSATADNYDQNIAFEGFDLHYQVDSPGSDSTGTKSF